VRLDLGLGDELVNFVADGFDLAIRSAGSTTPVYCASSLNASAMWLVAYLEAPGTPRTVAELANHHGILTRTDLDHWSVDKISRRLPAPRLQRIQGHSPPE
jgi:DNA-binding transcriptional LysR family regulator